MTEGNSTARPRKRKPTKPAKPHKDFPLFAHNNGQWAKKVRGKIHFFGVWADWQAALDRWLAERDELMAGRVPRSRHQHDTPTLRDLVNQFLTTKNRFVESGELTPTTWHSYNLICGELITAFGPDRLLTDILPEDFENLRAGWATRWGVSRLHNEINRARVVFNYAYKNRLIDRPLLYGEGFRRPSQKNLRIARAAKGPNMFKASELRQMIDKAAYPMKAMLLLGINCALGNTDIGQLRKEAINLKRGWLEYPRPKTGISRRCPLWPETVKAVEEAIKLRPSPKDDADADLVFLTRLGNPWTKGMDDRPITKECRKLQNRLKISGGRNFYSLRHTLETVGGDKTKDQVAVDAIMGHVDGSVAGKYREGICDRRLRAVTNCVKKWLFSNTR